MNVLALLAALVLAGCAPICNEPYEHAKPGWPWHDEEHLGFFGAPNTVAPEPVATVERVVEYVACP